MTKRETEVRSIRMILQCGLYFGHSKLKNLYTMVAIGWCNFVFTPWLWIFRGKQQRENKLHNQFTKLEISKWSHINPNMITDASEFRLYLWPIHTTCWRSRSVVSWCTERCICKFQVLFQWAIFLVKPRYMILQSIESVWNTKNISTIERHVEVCLGVLTN